MRAAGKASQAPGIGASGYSPASRIYSECAYALPSFALNGMVRLYRFQDMLDETR
jgi:hypothetical protein